MKTSILISACLLAAWTPAQRADYRSHLNVAGCKGTGSNICNGVNTLGGTLRYASATPVSYALQFTALRGRSISGCELFTRSLSGTTTATVRLLVADSRGRPGPGVASANFTIGTTPRFYRVTFTRPFDVQATQTMFLSFGPSPQMVIPVVRTGGTTPHYSGLVNNWQGPFAGSRWSWRLNCGQSRGGIPTISAETLPVLGRTFVLRLRECPPSVPVFLLFGTRVNLDLGRLGAPGCTIVSSSNLVIPTRSDGLGDSFVGLPIPNNSGLLGVKFLNQWIVVDRRANALGVTVSNLGVGLIGT